MRTPRLKAGEAAENTPTHFQNAIGIAFAANDRLRKKSAEAQPGNKCHHVNIEPI